MTTELQRFFRTKRNQELIENEDWITMFENGLFTAYPQADELFLILKECGAWAKYYDLVRARVRDLTDKVNMEFAKVNIPITCRLCPIPEPFGPLMDIDFLSDPQTFNDTAARSYGYLPSLNTLLYNKSKTNELQSALGLFSTKNQLTINNLCQKNDEYFEIKLNSHIKSVNELAQELVQKQLI